MVQPVRILVCPLNWGIGHASRMIPIIHKLLQSKAEVILGTGGKAGALLKAEFPNQIFIDLPFIPIRYSHSKSQVLIMMLQLPAFLTGIIREHRWLKKFVAANVVDVVISDNRYGLFHRKILSVLITHQVSPLLPAGLKWMESMVFCVLRGLIRRFDRCWIPDTGDQNMNLTGRLSHRYPASGNALFMGILSRFCGLPVINRAAATEIYDVLVILSGPEPQRTMLEAILVKQLAATGFKAAILCGLQQPVRQNYNLSSALIFYEHLPAPVFRELIMNAGVIICRSGYSTIMDLAELGRSAILIPTPGQPEQEYLAAYLNRKGWFHTAWQHNFDLRKEVGEFQLKKPRLPDLFRTDTGKYLYDLLTLYKHKKEYNQ